MSKLIEFINAHTTRGECQCGKCIDRGNMPDPPGHTADLVFFKVALQGSPSLKAFVSLSDSHAGEFNECQPLDGQEHSYIELGGWLGDQGVALRYMALGHLLSVFDLLTPKSILGDLIGPDLAMHLAGSGLITVKAKAKATAMVKEETTS